jgi:hypothetical protein
VIISATSWTGQVANISVNGQAGLAKEVLAGSDGRIYGNIQTDGANQMRRHLIRLEENWRVHGVIKRRMFCWLGYGVAKSSATPRETQGFETASLDGCKRLTVRSSHSKRWSPRQRQAFVF